MEMPKPANNSRAAKLSAKPRTVVRVFPILKDDGTETLAIPESIHWVLKNRVPCAGVHCDYCKEAVATGNKDIRARTYYRMNLLDMDTQTMEQYEVGGSVYEKLYQIIMEGGEKVIGPNGRDVVITFDKNKPPALMYSVMPSMADSTPVAAQAPQPTKASPDKPVAAKKTLMIKAKIGGVVKDVKDTGKRAGEELIVEVDGRLQRIKPDQVVTDAAPAKPAKATKPAPAKPVVAEQTAEQDGNVDDGSTSDEEDENANVPF